MNMNMSAHITQLCRSLNWHIRNLSRIRRFLNFNACHNAVCALILSKLDYCSCLLNGITKKEITRLQKLQNRCARLIFQKPRHTHTAPLLKELHWLPVNQRINFRTLVHTYKSLKSSAPDYLSSLLSIQTCSYSLRSSDGVSLTVPQVTKKGWWQSFFHCCSPSMEQPTPSNQKLRQSSVLQKCSQDTSFPQILLICPFSSSLFLFVSAMNPLVIWRYINAVIIITINYSVRIIPQVRKGKRYLNYIHWRKS